MKLEAVEIRELRIPLVQFFETSFGRTYDRNLIIIKLYSEGLTGYGESATSSSPSYSYETAGTCFHILEDFAAPLIVGRDVEGPEEMQNLLSPIRGHPMAKAGLEEALWDLIAKGRGKPLYKLLGGVRDKIYPGVSIGIQDSVKGLLTQIESFLNKGYRRIKIKIKPSWDLKVVSQVHENFPHIPLMVDANGAYSINDLSLFREMDRFNLMMIEQPLPYYDLMDHAKLQGEISTPICLDESINNLHDLKLAILLKSCRVVNIKPGRLGGLLASRAIHDLAHENGIPVWCGGMLETGIGRAHNVALSTLPNFTLPGDVSASDRYYAQDIIEPPFRLNPDGSIDVPQGPGIGVEVVEERLDKYTVRSVVVK